MTLDTDGQLNVVDQKELQLLRTKLTMVFPAFQFVESHDGFGKRHGCTNQSIGISKDEAKERAIRYLEKVGIDERARAKYRHIYRVVSSNEFRLPVHWRWNRKCCYLMSQHRRSIRNWLVKC